MNKFAVTVTFWCLVAAGLVFGIQETSAVTCNVMELSPCMGAVIGGTPPSLECCTKLKEQVPCLCGYTKNPLLAPYLENGKKTLATCGVPFPTC